MNAQAARLNQQMSARVRAKRRREELDRIETKRAALVARLAGDPEEYEALDLLTYGQLVARLHGTPPTLALSVDEAERINREGVVPRGTFDSE